MKLDTTIDKDEMTLFNELSDGDIFIHNEHIYMKINTAYIKNTNAVCLSTGDLYCIDDDTRIFPAVVAKLNVKVKM